MFINSKDLKSNLIYSLLEDVFAMVRDNQDSLNNIGIKSQGFRLKWKQ